MSSKLLSHRSWRVVAWSGTLLLIAACLLPSRNVPGPDAVGVDKVFHVLAFLAITFSWCRSGVGWRRAILLGLAVALLTEALQTAMGLGRQGDVVDLMADALGIFLGAALAARLPTSQATD